MPSKNSRRLRWALALAVLLHGLLAWRYAPQLRAGLDAALPPVDEPVPDAVEEPIEIAPAPPPRRALALVESLAGASPEALPPPLPDNFFPRPEPSPGSRMNLSAGLSAAPAVAPAVVPAALRLPDIVAVSAEARTPKPAATPPKPASPPVTAVRVAPQSRQPTPAPAPAPAPRGDAEDQAGLELAIRRAAETAERSPRAAPAAPPTDLRRLLPQGPLAETSLAPTLKPPRPVAPPPEPGITTYPLDAPVANDQTRAAPDEGLAGPALSRAQYFARLTAQLKAANQRVLAESVRAGSRSTVRMKFVVDREGGVLDVYPADAASSELGQRAAAVIRAAAPFPRIPASMVQPRLELSFPVELYR